MDRSTLASAIIEALQYNKMAENGVCHSLPQGVSARMEGNESWREPSYCTNPGPPNKDALMPSDMKREDMLKLALGKVLLHHLMPEGTLKDSILATQAKNLEMKMNGEKGPFTLLLNYRW